jgi:hypothetical protein
VSISHNDSLGAITSIWSSGVRAGNVVENPKQAGDEES